MVKLSYSLAGGQEVRKPTPKQIENGKPIELVNDYGGSPVRAPHITIKEVTDETDGHEPPAA